MRSVRVNFAVDQSRTVGFFAATGAATGRSAASAIGAGTEDANAATLHAAASTPQAPRVLARESQVANW